jgi:hypothetical protein
VSVESPLKLVLGFAVIGVGTQPNALASMHDHSNKTDTVLSKFVCVGNNLVVKSLDDKLDQLSR